MTKKRQETEIRNADNHGVIAGQIIDRAKVANDRLGPLVLASLMSANAICNPSYKLSTIDATESGTAESIAKQRETSIDDLLADPMMSAVWRAYAITEHDVRRLVHDVTDRLKSHGELHRRAEALVAPLLAQCA